MPDNVIELPGHRVIYLRNGSRLAILHPVKNKDMTVIKDGVKPGPLRMIGTVR